MRQEQQNMPWINGNKEDKYLPAQNLTFGQAIDALKQGALISRNGNNGTIFLQKGKIDYNSFGSIALNDVSGVPYHLFELGGEDITTAIPCLIIDKDGVLSIYTPTTDDILAEDWTVKK